MEKQSRTIITLYGQHSRWGVIDRKKAAQTLVAGMGCGGGIYPDGD